MPTRQEIAARVKALRKEHGSHDKLAAKLGKPVTRQRIMNHEKTGRMKRVSAQRYARLTKTSASEWLEDEEPTSDDFQEEVRAELAAIRSLLEQLV